ncbi:MAG: hypothetical protein ACR2IV_12715 [Bryobacteraceae bacterium]
MEVVDCVREINVGLFSRAALSRHENPTLAGTPQVNFCVISIFQGIIVRENLSEVWRWLCRGELFYAEKTV